MTIPDYRRPPANPAAAIAQSRGWFLFKINNEPMVYRRKAVWYTPLGKNVREFVGDDFEPMGHMLSAKMPTTTADIFTKAWQETVAPPLYVGG